MQQLFKLTLTFITRVTFYLYSSNFLLNLSAVFLSPMEPELLQMFSALFNSLFNPEAWHLVDSE
jgi:hypothetical protein